MKKLLIVLAILLLPMPCNSMETPIKYALQTCMLATLPNDTLNIIGSYLEKEENGEQLKARVLKKATFMNPRWHCNLPKEAEETISWFVRTTTLDFSSFSECSILQQSRATFSEDGSKILFAADCGVKQIKVWFLIYDITTKQSLKRDYLGPDKNWYPMDISNDGQTWITSTYHPQEHTMEVRINNKAATPKTIYCSLTPNQYSYDIDDKIKVCINKQSTKVAIYSKSRQETKLFALKDQKSSENLLSSYFRRKLICTKLSTQNSLNRN